MASNPLELDRDEVDRASLDAADRLRARLTGSPLPRAAPPRRAVLPWVMAGGLFVFAAGMIANPWFEAAVRDRLPFADSLGPRTAEDADVAAMQQRLARLEARTVTAPAPVERLARTEARIEFSADQLQHEADRIDRLTAQLGALSAAVSADRDRLAGSAGTATAAAVQAERQLVLLMARRALGAGRPLGPVDAALRRNFEADEAAAVAAVTAWGTTPVTPGRLGRDFAALRLSLRPQAGQAVGWGTALRLMLASMVSATDAAARPADVAAAALAHGDVAAAAAALRRLPRSVALDAWLADADRLMAGERGLARLEQRALTLPAAPLPKAALPATAPPPLPLPR